MGVKEVASLREGNGPAPLRPPLSAHPWFLTVLSRAAHDMMLQRGGGTHDQGGRTCLPTALAPFPALKRMAVRWRKTPEVSLAERMHPH